MNMHLDFALCIGGSCPKRTECARWTVYDDLRDKIDEREDKHAVTITTPPYTYNDGCFMFMRKESSHENR